MVLKVGDIIESGIWSNKYHITDITETIIRYNVYRQNMEPVSGSHNKKIFEKWEWKPAEIKWY